MLRKRKPSVQPGSDFLSKSITAIPWLKKFLPGDPLSLANVGLLVDVFSAFALLDGKVLESETNVILDLLRHANPEADHGWLARRLQSSLRKTSSLDELAVSMISKLTPLERTSLALQLFLLIESSSQKSQGRKTFVDFMEKIELKAEGEALLSEFEHFASSSSIPAIETLTIGPQSADIPLGRRSESIRCKLFRSGPILLLQNAGASMIQLGGTHLHSGGCTRLRAHQRLLLPDWNLAQTDLHFFIDAKYGKQTRTLFLGKSDDILIVEKNRSRDSFLKIKFDLKAKLTVLKNTELQLPNHDTISVGHSYVLRHFDSITPSPGNPLSLNQLRQQALDAGSRFKLQKKKQSCLVSNQGETTGENCLRLTPGLAEPTTLKITFDQESGTGLLEIISQGKSPILVNEAPIIEEAPLQDGCLIRLSPNQGIRCRFSEGLLDEERTIIQVLRVDGLSHSFGSKMVLDNIDFQLTRGEMLCVMGPSGSGKSTLLAAIAGQLNPSRGHIRLNEISLYKHHARLSRFITYMPQEEALSSQLTVREHLRYAIRIRQPNLNLKETKQRIDTILDEISLQPLANRKVGSPDDKSLSGGERSRLNLGLDLGSQAEVFLFDEPISGLSSKDSEHVVESLKNISQDKIVIASLHRPGAKILSQFNKVLLIDNGGCVAYFGSPLGMRDYFKNAAQELQINLNIAENEKSADFAFDVLETPLVDIVNTQTFASTRRFPPAFWQERFESLQLYKNVERGDMPAQTNLGDLPRSDDNMPIPKKGRRKSIEYFRLFLAHFWRSSLSKSRNQGTLYATFLEAPLLALIIAWTLRASADGPYAFNTGLHIVTYLFMSVTVGMFLGLTNSATEILRDRPTLRRERNCRYNNGLYILAKFISLSILAALQCAIFITLGNWMLEIHGMWIDHWIWMTLTAMTGTAIAIFISSVVKTERAALSAVPLVLVPQLLLAGTPLIPFEEMNRGLFSGAEESRSAGKEPSLSRIIPLRYAYEGITVHQATNNLFEQSRRQLQEQADALKQEKDFLLIYKNQGLNEEKRDRLNTLLRGITKLYSLGAKTSSEAESKINALLYAAQFGSDEDVKNIINPEGDDVQSCEYFFVNQRTRQLVLKQDIQRVDFSQEHQRNIFLAEKKYYGEMINPEYIKLSQLLTPEEMKAFPESEDFKKHIPRPWSTSKLCMGVLASLCLILTFSSALFLFQSNRKMS